MATIMGIMIGSLPEGVVTVSGWAIVSDRGVGNIEFSQVASLI
jgi:hypothetical protein